MQCAMCALLCALLPGRAAWAEPLAPTAALGAGLALEPLAPVTLAPPVTLGAGWLGTPGYFRVPVVAAAQPGVLLTGGVGYGFTEGQTAAPGGHHRVQGRLAASLSPLPWLDLALGTNLRHDRHADDGRGADQGTVLDSDLHAHAGTLLGPDFHLGGALGAAFTRGDTLGLSLENPRIDLLLLGAYLPQHQPFSLGVLAGYRYDRTAGVARDPARYRAGDRLSLQVSEFDAVPLGVGGAYRLGMTELLTELSADVLVGSGAPRLVESPLRWTAGARHRLGDELSLRVVADTSLSARPAVGASDPLLPVEPRFQLLVGMAYQWSPGPAMSTPPEAAPVLQPKPVPAAAPVALASVVVRVTTIEGYALSDATVEILTGDAVLAVPHGELERYGLEKVPVGEATLRVSAARLLTHTQPITLRAGAPLQLEVKLAPAPPTGQVRGLIRSFSGVGLRARVRIEPIGKEIQTDAAGTFQLDVPPGAYEVVVEAPGHAAQRRQVRVPEDGVVILNADLLRGQP
ncbi:MAG: hypothetical protein RL033_7767 [Pseudomonadota bacterium]|jgi:hypothetical protein